MGFIQTAKYIWDGFIDEFKLFATEGKTIDIAIGTILGAGITPVANSIVDDIVMPPIGLLLGKADLPNQYFILSEGEKGGPYKTLKEAQEDGAVTINYGRLANRGITLVVILSVAFGIVKLLNAVRESQEKELAEEKAKTAMQQATFQNKNINIDTLVEQARTFEQTRPI